MRSRWYHTPLLHTANLAFHKKVSWLELFYDLMFVASFIQLGNGLSENVTVNGFLLFAAIFLTLWFSWSGFAYYSNRYNVDDFVHRALVFAQMFAVAVMTISAKGVISGETFTQFALAYAGAQLCIALMYLRSYMQQKLGRHYAAYWGGVFCLGSILWAIAAFCEPGPMLYICAFVGVAVIVAAPFNRFSRSLSEVYPTDEEHMSERFALLTLIVLGESFVKVLSYLSDQQADAVLILKAVTVLILTISLWWIYFDDVAGAKIKKTRLAPIIWFFSHLPLQMAITSTGVAIKKISKL